MESRSGQPLSQLLVFRASILALWLGLGLSCWAQQAQEPLQLKHAIDRALEKNLELLAKRFDLDIAKARIITAGMHPNPTLSLGADHLDWLGTIYDEENAAGPSEYSIRSDWVFEGGGKRARRLEVAELSERVTQLELREAARQLVLDVENAFVEVALEQGHLHLAQENRDGFNRILRISQERVRAGDLAKVELMRTRLAQLHYDNSVILAQSRLRTAKQKLLLLMGHSGPEVQFEVEGQLPRPSLSQPLAEMEQIAISRRPDYLALLKDQERGEAAIRLEEANGKPDYVAGIEYRRQQGLAGRGNSVGLFFAVPLPIFDTNEGEVERARQEYQQLLARAKALEASIKQQLASARQEYEAAERTVLQIESSMLSQARQVLDTMEYAYRAGHASLVELLDAQRTYNETVSSYNEALAQYARSRFALEAITGGNL